MTNAFYQTSESEENSHPEQNWGHFQDGPTQWTLPKSHEELHFESAQSEEVTNEIPQRKSLRNQLIRGKKARFPKAAGGSVCKGRGGYKHVPHREKPAHLVARRNARERRRVQAVNLAFAKLRGVLPIENRGKRVSKVKTLKKAMDYIEHLQQILDMTSNYDGIYHKFKENGNEASTVPLFRSQHEKRPSGPFKSQHLEREPSFPNQSDHSGNESVLSDEFNPSLDRSPDQMLANGFNAFHLTVREYYANYTP